MRTGGFARNDLVSVVFIQESVISMRKRRSFSRGRHKMQTDAFVGQIVAAVDAGGFIENTIIIVSSDNGCPKTADIPAL